MKIEERYNLYFLTMPGHDEIVLDEAQFQELYRVLFLKHYQKEHAKYTKTT